MNDRRQWPARLALDASRANAAAGNGADYDNTAGEVEVWFSNLRIAASS